MIRRTLLGLGLVVVVLLAGLRAAPQGSPGGVHDGDRSNWPQFRGLQAGVADDDPALPDTWSTTQNVLWKVEIPGNGWSSPIVWGNHVFVTSAINTEGNDTRKATYYRGESGSTTAIHRWVVYDVDLTTGRVRWQREVATAVPPGKHLKNSYATETPATDGQRVYAYFGNVGLFAFDMNGTPLWSKTIGPFKTSDFGTSGSPVVYKDRIYIVNDNLEQSFLAAYDSKTGNEVWRVNRDENSNYSTPFIWESGQRTEIVTTGARRVRSYDLNGKLLWDMSGLTGIHIPTPFAKHGLLYITSGFRAEDFRPIYAIRGGGSGDISLKKGETSNEYIAWMSPTLGSYTPSGLVYGDYYYTLYDTSFLMCHDAKTGKEIYSKRRLSAGSTGFSASPWAYNGKIFAMSEDGDTFVVQAGPEFKILGKNSLDEMTLATPAVVRGSLIVRTASKLYRIGKNGTG